MKLLITLMATLFVTLTANAQNVQPFYRDIKLPRQAVVEVQNFGALIAASATNMASGYAGPTSSAATTLTSFSAQPDQARNLVITPGGTTADVAASTITVNGTDISGRSISEGFVFAANASSATTGAKAFKTVTSVVFPLEDSPYGATWSIGFGEKIGLRKCMDDAGGWVQSSAGGVKETTAATVTANASTLSLNTADFNGTMNASNVFKGYYMQNYACYP